jgi:hypothetical protein
MKGKDNGFTGRTNLRIDPLPKRSENFPIAPSGVLAEDRKHGESKSPKPGRRLAAHRANLAPLPGTDHDPPSTTPKQCQPLSPSSGLITELGAQAMPVQHRQTQRHHQRPQMPRRPPVHRSLHWVGHRRQPGNCENREEPASVGNGLTLRFHARHRIPKDRSASMLPVCIVSTGQVGSMSASSSLVCRAD